MPVAAALPKEEIIAEIEKLPAAALLGEHHCYQVFGLFLERYPGIRHEIGRLREITYRATGEGSFQTLDLDAYDEHYEQFIVWDRQQQTIIGGYRLGLGKHVIDTYGLQGLYTSSLQTYLNPFLPILENAVELGRSFVVQEHQQRPFPLLLLWKALFKRIVHTYKAQYVLGCMSITPDYPKASLDLILAYLLDKHYNPDLAQHITPKHPVDLSELPTNRFSTLPSLEKHLKLQDPNHPNIPILLKKYLSQQAEMISIGTDPEFNNCLDIFMLLDTQNIPKETKALLGEQDVL